LRPILNLVGRKFNRLTVVSFNRIEKNKSLWDCICECGKEVTVIGSNLTNGNTKSCKCLIKEKSIENLNPFIVQKVDIKIGQIFGKLTVIESAGLDKYGNFLYKCQCLCGKKKIIVGRSLASNLTRSCGCYRQECLSGENSRFWLGGISFEPYCPKFNNDLKRRIRTFFNNQCAICGKTTEKNGAKLSCHHIEYNKMSCCDGKPVHFASLCRSCHSKTNKGREKWESMLHRIIDEIYDGKSYYTKEEYKNVVH